MIRRQLCNELANLQQVNRGPSCMIGDFNVVIGSHEKFGSFPSNKTSTDDFYS